MDERDTVLIWSDLDVELLDSDSSLLAHTPCPPNSLLLQCWVQGRLQNEDMVGRSEVDAHTAAAHGEQEDSGGWVLLERFYRLHGIKSCKQC